MEKHCGRNTQSASRNHPAWNGLLSSSTHSQAQDRQSGNGTKMNLLPCWKRIQQQYQPPPLLTCQLITPLADPYSAPFLTDSCLSTWQMVSLSTVFHWHTA